MFKLFGRLYDKKIDAIGLAFFRVAYFLVLFADMAQLFYFQHLVFDRVPYLQPYEVNLGLALGVWLICIVFLIFGAFTRTMVIANYIFTLVFLSTISTYEYHVFYTYTTVNFFCLFLPISRRFSLDRLWKKLKYSNTRYTYKPPKKTTVLSYLLPLLVVNGFVYFDSVFYKLTSDFWMAGLGVWYPSSFPQFAITSTSGLGGFLINNEYLTKFFGYLTVVFETVFIFLFWFRRFRLPLLIIGVGLHLGILISFPIPWFALAVVAAYILMVPVGIFKKIGGFLFPDKESILTVYYDEECPLCARAKITIEFFDLSGRVAFKGVQSNRKDEAIKDIELKELLHNIYSVTSKGKVQYGLDTYIKVFDAIWYFVPLGLLLRIPGIYHIAKLIYRFVANNREVERCTEKNCGYKLPNPPQDTDKIKLLQKFTVKKLRVRLITLGVLGLILLQMAISYTSGIFLERRMKAGTEGKLTENLTWLSHKADKYGRPFLGMTHHPVFMDFHFEGYNHIIGLSYEGEDGQSEWLPIVRKDGSPSTYLLGFNWVKWTFRVNSPGNIMSGSFYKGVQDFTAFWMHKNNKSPLKSTFKIHLKIIDIPDGFVYGYLETQRQKPWMEIGTMKWENNRAKLEIQPKFQGLFR